jgi:Spy/CpxP family protein refolding chaperone
MNEFFACDCHINRFALTTNSTNGLSAVLVIVGRLRPSRRTNVKLQLKKISAGAVGAAVLLAAAAVVFSQQPQGPPPGPPPGGFRPGPGGPGGPPPDGFGFRGPGGPGGPREGFGPGAPGRPGGPPPEGFGPFGPAARELNLTDDQRNAIHKIGESFRDDNRALLEQMRTLHESQRELINGEFNEAAVRAAAEARAKVQVELEISHARMMSQMVGVLTSEQKAQLAAGRQEMQRMGPPMQPQPPQ